VARKKVKSGGRYLARWRAAKLKEENMSNEERTYRERLEALVADICEIKKEFYFMSVAQVGLALDAAISRSETLAIALAPIEDQDPLGYAVGAKEALRKAAEHEKAIRQAAEQYAEEVDDVGE